MTELTNHLQKIQHYQMTDFRWSNLRKFVKKYITGRKVLDAGCGSGHLTLDLLQENYDVTAIDSSDEMVLNTQKNVTDAHFSATIFSCDLLSIQNQNLTPFDTIISLDVIEHIEKDTLALRNFFGLLKNEGTLILSVPAIKIFYGDQDKKLGHYRRYNKKELTVTLNNAGFEIFKIQYWNFIGILPYVLFEKILHKSLNDTIRYSRTSKSSEILNRFLNYWFSIIENNIPFPVGLTLIAVCKKRTDI